MRRFSTFVLAASLLVGGGVRGWSAERNEAMSVAPAAPLAPYFWQSEPVGDRAELVTLYCDCRTADVPQLEPVPLVSVLRDTLGDADPENDRLTYVWLLSYRRPSVGRQMLSAVPFFYWRPGRGSDKPDNRTPKPLFNLASPQHPMLSEAGRDLLQWTILDTATPIRATSRAYRTNEEDSERLHLEQAISYLRAAPAFSGPSALTDAQVNQVIARLELRKRLLGGLVNDKNAARLGEEDGFRYERIRSRNWELLRQCAEKTGLYFEPLDLAGANGQYAILWFPVDVGASDGQANQPAALWKLLAIKNPWRDPRVSAPGQKTFDRQLDDDGKLLPEGVAGSRSIRLLPLSVYSLSYPKLPLLLVDFRDRLRVRRQEMTQRTINEVTSGVIGISHFTNWYYYIAADLYDFYAERHGAAMNQAERLDCYSQFRAKLALDHQLDSALRADLRQRVDALALNPLEISPENEMQVASARYASLLAETSPEGALIKRVDNDRRQELASFGEPAKKTFARAAWHDVTLGAYTYRVAPALENVGQLDVNRRVQYQLNFLENLTEAGTPPEVAYDSGKIQHSVNELGSLLDQVSSPAVRDRAISTIGRIRELSQDSVLQADCAATVASIREQHSGPGLDVAAEPVAIRAGNRVRQEPLAPRPAETHR